VCRNVPRLVSSWKLPVIVARHAFGDQYQALEMPVPGKGRLSLVWRSHENAPVQELAVCDFDAAGVALAMFNLDSSIQAFARACFNYALQRKLPLFLSTKNTILKIYDGRFKNIFAEIFESEFKDAFQAAGIAYEHRLIDDMVAYALKSEGGYVWACKNYDGDVMSDAIAQGYGSLGLMTSVLISEDGKVLLSEAAHGTVTRHFRLHKQGQPTSTNPIASIFAWTKALFQRGTVDENQKLMAFARSLEKACVDTVESGCMTKDLAICIHNQALAKGHYVHTDDFIEEVSRRLKI
jgi:isocitrate dehydrogenase